jgi:dual-specificity kinase
MSTPSTATAILPQPHHHYGFPHHQDFEARERRGPAFASNSILNGPSRLGSSSQYNFPTNTTPQAAASTTRQSDSTPRNARQNASDIASSDTSKNMSSRKRARGPDWTEFYKNGLPREVIVIDDDTPPPPARVGTKAFDTQRANPVNRPSGSKRTIADIEAELPASKKRKTAISNGYDPRPQPAGYPPARTSGYDDSNSNSTRSTDRTTSAFHTTAATSLGSHYSQSGVPTDGETLKPKALHTTPMCLLRTLLSRPRM